MSNGVWIALIVMFATISGAHFNPAVTLSFVMQGQLEKRIALLYVIVQVVGGLAPVSSGAEDDLEMAS